MALDRGGKEVLVGDTILIPAKVIEVGAGDVRFVVEGQQPPDPLVLASVFVVKVTPTYVIPSE